MFIYSKRTGIRDSAYGKIATPIKMIIERESNLLEQQGGACSQLFNVEKSNKFGETIINQAGFDTFTYTAEGSAALLDTVYDTGRKFIEHIQFMKEFIITAEMMEDANYGVAAEAKRKAQSFARAYYKTINKICAHALTNGNYRTTTFAGATLDLTTADSWPLFFNSHMWGGELKRGTQCNFYCGDLVNTGRDTRVFTPEQFPETLFKLEVLLRNMLDENGEPMGYTADTIIIPGNRHRLEQVVKATCGSEKITGSSNNDINLHFGNWNIIVLPTWIAGDDRIIVMSSEANKNLGGNMFFNRVPLTVTDWVDHHTGNYIWNGRCRFGVGFGSYKHAILMVDCATDMEGSNMLP